MILQRSFSQVSSIKTFDFSTLYTTLPHDKLKTRFKETIHKAFSHRNYGSKCVALGYNSTYFSNKFWWRIPERKILIEGYPKDLKSFSKSTCDLCQYASKQFHNMCVVPLLLNFRYNINAKTKDIVSTLKMFALSNIPSSFGIASLLL
jgi:hypothetical protein